MPRIPILMYHSVSYQSSGIGHPYFELNTVPEVFDLQMSFLRDLGYRVIGLGEVVSLVSGLRGDDEISGEKYAVVTFDDGFRNIHDTAYPILAKYGFSATAFLPTKYMGCPRRVFDGRDCLTWDEVRFLSDAGMEFGSHSVTHDLLIRMDPERIERELIQSKHEIEHETGKGVNYFSYPYRYPEQNREFVHLLERLLARTGYRAAVSTRIGTVKRGDAIYSLKRIPVNSNDDPRMFQAKLEGGYDWLHPLQYLKKRLRINK